MLSWLFGKARRSQRPNERDIIASSGLFDEVWYNEKNPPAENQSGDAIERYLADGAARDLRPHPLFHVKWYRASNPDLPASGLTPLGHYISVGRARGASPSPLFDPDWYRRQSPELSSYTGDLFHHFVTVGALQGLSPHPLFNSKSYLAAKPELIANKVNPLTHYVEIGASQGLAPNPSFDSRWYVDEYEEVGESGESPLIHFIISGASTGYQPHPRVDLDLYVAKHPEAGTDRLSAFIQFVTSGEPLNGPLVDTSRTPAAKLLHSEIASRTQKGGHFSKELTTVRSFRNYLSLSDDCPQGVHASDPAHFLRSMAGAAAVSLDVWDTLLRRDCHPDEIKLQSARFLLFRAFVHLRPAYWDIVALFRARLDAERRSTPAEDQDGRLDDSIALWLAQVLKPESHSANAAPLHNELITHELIAERRCIRPDETMSSLLPLIAVPMVFASDHYLSVAQIRGLLEEVHLARFFATGFVSSHHAATKRSGRLFDRILIDLALPPEQVVHIGDNPKTDVTMPEARGIRALGYSSASEENRKLWFGEAFHRRLDGDLTLHRRRVLMIVEKLAKHFEVNSCDHQRAAGARISPIFISFVLRVLADAIGRNPDRVFFFRREGVFLKKLYDAIREADPFNIAAPPSELLDVSRTAAFSASLEQLSVPQLMRMWHQYDTQSFSALAASLGLDQTIAAEAAARQGLDFHEPIAKPWLSEKFVAALVDPSLRNHAQSRFAEQKSLLLAHLSQKGFLSDRKKASVVVDIGWRGTIQDSICLLTRQETIGHYLALYKYLAPQPQGATKYGWLGDENKGDVLDIEEVAVLETLCSAPGGTVVGYRDELDRVAPILLASANEEEAIATHYSAIQAGVLAAVSPLCDYVRAHGLTPEDLLDLARSLTRALVQSPPRAIADAFFSLDHNEMFGNGRVFNFSGAKLIQELAATRQTSALHAHARTALSALRWPSGVANTSKFTDWYRSAPAAEQFSIPTSMFKAQLEMPENISGAKLVVYSPPPLAASGGHRTLFRIVRQLARLGFETHVMVEDVGPGLHILEEYLEYQPVTFHDRWVDIPCDLALASIARSAHFVADLRNAARRAYLVQDFEALFEPMGDGYINGENSYARGLRHLTIGNWLTHFIGCHFGLPGAPAGLGVDTEKYRPKNTVTREFAVCALYQPEKSRRTPRFVTEVLQILARRLPGLKMYTFGSAHRPPIDGNVENLGVIQDLNELNALYNRCLIGFCPSTSNPSRIPYEMMAAGCIPVDLYRYNNLLDYQDGTACLAYQSPQSVASAIEWLASNQSAASERREACIKFALSRTEAWETDVTCNHILSAMSGRDLMLGEISLPAAYAEKPFIAADDDTGAIRRFCEAQREQADRPLWTLNRPSGDLQVLSQLFHPHHAHEDQ
ncbi:MAG: hypothetical protein ACOY4R_31620 [Pseudomonadota bacterium]